jgi:hypothetical protein
MTPSIKFIKIYLIFPEIKYAKTGEYITPAGSLYATGPRKAQQNKKIEGKTRCSNVI